MKTNGNVTGSTPVEGTNHGFPPPLVLVMGSKGGVGKSVILRMFARPFEGQTSIPGGASVSSASEKRGRFGR